MVHENHQIQLSHGFKATHEDVGTLPFGAKDSGNRSCTFRTSNGDTCKQRE